MKNYLVYEEWHNDMDGGRDFHLFNSLEKAKEFFEDTIKKSVDDLGYDTTDENIVVDKTDMLYEIYEDGYYLANRYVAIIKELEIL